MAKQLTFKRSGIETVFPRVKHGGVDHSALISRLNNSEAANTLKSHPYSLRHLRVADITVDIKIDPKRASWMFSGFAELYKKRIYLNVSDSISRASMEALVTHEYAHLLLDYNKTKRTKTGKLRHHGVEYNALLAALAWEMFQVRIDCSKQGYYPQRSFERLLARKYSKK